MKEAGVRWRPATKKLHTFRSRIVEMANDSDGRLTVILENGKIYVSNKKHTRWRKVGLLP